MVCIIDEIVEQFDVTREQIAAVLDFAARQPGNLRASLMLILLIKAHHVGWREHLPGHTVKEKTAHKAGTLFLMEIY